MATACDNGKTLLERYLDDELGFSDRDRVEHHLADCPACEQRLVAMRLGADLLRSHLQRVADQADFSGFEDRVMAGIERQRRPSFGERLAMWLRETLYYHRTAWIASTVTAAAVVLALALLLPWLRGDSAGPAGPEPRPGPVQIAQIDNADKAGNVDNEVIIDSMEYAGKRSMIFTVSKNNTTVIWMYDFDGPGALDRQGDEI